MINFYRFYILLVLLVVFSSCAINKNFAKKNNDTIIIDDSKNNTVIIDETKPAKENTKAEADDTKPIKVEKESKTGKSDTTKAKDSNYELKKEYNLAIILPLMSDSVKTNWNNHYKSTLEDFKLPYASKEALQFLEGAILALENLDLNSKINIKIYDNESSASKTSSILSQLEAEKIDFIVGPIKKQDISLVSEYAKKKNIIMLSPFSPSKSASSNYSRYIMPNPSLDVHFLSITNYIKDSMQGSHVKIVYQNSENGKKHAQSIQAMFKALNDSLPTEKKVKFTLLDPTDKRNISLTNHLISGEKNVVIVTSFNEGYVHNMLTSLNQESKNKNITVFGMPNWKDSNVLRLDYFNNLRVHYTDSQWIDEEEENTKSFIENYKEKFKLIPEFNAYLGYDVFTFFPLLIDKYGLSLEKNISKETYKGILNSYHFEPLSIDIDEENAASQRIENTHLHIISFKNYKLNLENK